MEEFQAYVIEERDEQRARGNMRRLRAEALDAGELRIRVRGSGIN